MGVRFSHPQPNRSRKAAVFSGHSAAGSAPGSGLGGRGFKSRCSDQKTDAERHPSFFVAPRNVSRKRNGPNEINDFNGFTVPPENHETNGFNEITISRYPPKSTISTKSTKSRFHGPPTESRKQRNPRKQRNASFAGISFFSLCMEKSLVSLGTLKLPSQSRRPAGVSPAPPKGEPSVPPSNPANEW